MLNKKNQLIKCLVVGLGNIGFTYDKGLSQKFVFSHTRACLKNEKVELLAGIDPNETRRNDFAKKTRIKTFARISDFKNKIKQTPDIVIICVPTQSHLKVFREVLGLKPKMIILEKPLSFSLKEAQEIVRLAKKEKVILFVNYQRRFNNFLQNIKKEIKSKKYGKFVRGCVKYKGGVYNSGSHAINLLSFWLGDLRIASVSNKRILPNGDFSADFILQTDRALINFENFSNIDFDVSEYDLFFEKGRLRYLDILMQCEIYVLQNNPYFKGRKQLFKKKSVFLNDFSKYQNDVLSYALRVLEGEAKNISSSEDGLETMNIIEQIKKCKKLSS